MSTARMLRAPKKHVLELSTSMRTTLGDHVVYLDGNEIHVEEATIETFSETTRVTLRLRNVEVRMTGDSEE